MQSGLFTAHNSFLFAVQKLISTLMKPTGIHASAALLGKNALPLFGPKWQKIVEVKTFMEIIITTQEGLGSAFYTSSI